jgi:hypothetical protein
VLLHDLVAQPKPGESGPRSLRFKDTFPTCEADTA